MKIDQKSETGYDYLFKNNKLLFSRTIDYCFLLFSDFCNLIFPKQGIEMQIFSKQVVGFLKHGHLLVKLHSSNLKLESPKLVKMHFPH